MICFVCETAYGKISWEIFNYGIKNISMIYSQTCIKRSPLGQRKRWPFDTGDCFTTCKKWSTGTQKALVLISDYWYWLSTFKIMTHTLIDIHVCATRK
jgi:hypothetical protein